MIQATSTILPPCFGIANGIGNWISTTSYPIGAATDCVSSANDIYCIGGTTAAVYYAPITTNSVGAWKSTTSYPFAIYAQSCTLSSGYIYCVGGQYANTVSQDSVYYAPIAGNALGAWKSTTPYPASYGISLQSCASTSNDIYCVGGTRSGGGPINNVYYAPISSNGVGSWSSTTSYPTTVEQESCNISNSYIYCVSGTLVYYAPISNGGVGSWSSTTSYPSGPSDQSCSISNGYIYCVGGYSGPTPLTNAYYAPVTSFGIGNWASTANYPIPIEFNSCTSSDGYLYCAGGFSSGYSYVNSVYYAPACSVPAPQLTQPTISLSESYPYIVVNSSFSGGYQPDTLTILTSNTLSGCPTGAAAYQTSVSGSGTLSVSNEIVYPGQLTYYCAKVSDSAGDVNMSTVDGIQLITPIIPPSGAIVITPVIPPPGMALMSQNSSYGTILSFNRTSAYAAVTSPPYTITWYYWPSQDGCLHEINIANITTSNSLQYADLLVSPSTPTYYCAVISPHTGPKQTFGIYVQAIPQPSNTVSSPNQFYLPPAVNGCTYGSIYNVYIGANQPCQTLQLSAIEADLGGSSGLLATYISPTDANDPIIGMFNTYYNGSSVEAVTVNCRGQSKFPCIATFYFNSTKASPINLVSGPYISD